MEPAPRHLPEGSLAPSARVLFTNFAFIAGAHFFINIQAAAAIAPRRQRAFVREITFCQLSPMKFCMLSFFLLWKCNRVSPWREFNIAYRLNFAEVGGSRGSLHRGKTIYSITCCTGGVEGGPVVGIEGLLKLLFVENWWNLSGVCNLLIQELWNCSIYHWQGNNWVWNFRIDIWPIDLTRWSHEIHAISPITHNWKM